MRHLLLGLCLLASTVDAEWYTVTAYSFGCILPKSGIEPIGKTRAANGKWPEANWTVAAPKELPFDTVLELSYQGIITTRIVGDRGRAIKGKRLDLFVANCERAKAWGRRRVWVREIRRPLGSYKTVDKHNRERVDSRKKARTK